MRRLFTVSILAALMILVLAGCNSGFGKITEPYKDAPRGATNNQSADIITMPDGFNNVSAKCDGPNRVYVVYHSNSAYGAVAVAPNDPRCK
jgi:hypothetical protein